MANLLNFDLLLFHILILLIFLSKFIAEMTRIQQSNSKTMYGRFVGNLIIFILIWFG